ncbi:MAG TPA: wax ester/triacylglycerol synthase family O-acyltransferase [Solirubrobacteraceae bacterium]|jgi:WS/DGAT/MGAT family acyltransferase
MTPTAEPHRLSALDGSFLRLESAQSHMHVGWSAVLAAPGERPRPTVEALRARIAGRVHRVPWSRWRLDGAPLGLSEPRWIEDPDFDLAAHVVQVTDPRDAVSLKSFEALRSALLSTPLDRTRPLWQIYLIPRLEDGRVGMVGKIHHAVVDGIAALQIVSLFADPHPDGVTESPVLWEPGSRPGSIGWAMDALRQGIGDGIGVLRAGSQVMTQPLTMASRALHEARRLAGAVADDVLPAAPLSKLNGPIGARRTLVGYHAPRDLLRSARRGGGTLNDIGLAAVTGALRALAIQRGEQPNAPLKTMVPVSMRQPGDDDAGNKIAMVYIPLPVHVASPTARLELVREQTSLLKHTDRAGANQALFETAGLVPAPLRSPVARAMATPRQFNLTVSQSPAPRGAMYMLGCELEEVYSVVPIAQGHALAIGMVRYRNELFFGCYADPDKLPEVHELPALLAAELRALAAAAPRRREPAARSNGRARVPVG